MKILITRSWVFRFIRPLFPLTCKQLEWSWLSRRWSLNNSSFECLHVMPAINNYIPSGLSDSCVVDQKFLMASIEKWWIPLARLVRPTLILKLLRQRTSCCCKIPFQILRAKRVVDNMRVRRSNIIRKTAPTSRTDSLRANTVLKKSIAFWYSSTNLLRQSFVHLTTEYTKYFHRSRCFLLRCFDRVLEAPLVLVAASSQVDHLLVAVALPLPLHWSL